MFNLMLESVVEFANDVAGTTTERERSLLVAPGFRTGWNRGEKQIVVGVAVPVTNAAGQSTVALLGYLSYELPFRAAR